MRRIARLMLCATPVVVACLMVTRPTQAQNQTSTEAAAALRRPFPAAVVKERQQDSTPVAGAEEAKVVGGKPAKNGQFKWQVALILSNAPIDDPFKGFF